MLVDRSVEGGDDLVAAQPTTTTTGPSPDAVTASTAHATRGLPRHSSKGFEASPPRRDPRPAARIGGATVNRRGPGPARSGVMRTMTRWSRTIAAR